jgi:hypothetical protein
VVEALEEKIEIAPLPACVLPPLMRDKAPPMSADDCPADKNKSPPMPDVPEPTTRLMEPPRPPEAVPL